MQLAASVDGNVDVESPANISPQLIVRILSELTVADQLFEGKATLPVHSRYHNSQPGGGFR